VDGKLSGIVFDPSGARVPGCHVIARSLDGLTVIAVVTDFTGAYKFDMLPGQYLLEFDEPGFHPYLVMAQQQPQTIWLTVGSIFLRSEVVGGPKPAIVGVAPQPGAPQRIKVGGNVQPAQLIAKPEPVYPAELQQLGIEGSVVIRTIVSKTGEPTRLQVINTEIDSRLAQAALDAVRQWRYQPTLLNGEPVDIETNVTVSFKLTP
jgi:TonB family protein